MMAERPSDGKNRTAVEGIFTGNSTNSISAKEFSAHANKEKSLAGKRRVTLILTILNRWFCASFLQRTSIDLSS